MDTRQLRYFAAIYEHGTLTRAAEHTRVAVSALSHHLANLEKDLAAPLFDRQPRRMQPTAAGERLYVHAKAILRAMSSAERDVRETGDEVSGDVSVGLAFSVVKAIALPLMQRVLDTYPNLRLSISESLSGSALMHLMTSEVDLALAYNPPPDARMKTQAILEEQMVCVGRRDMIGGTDDPMRFDDILELPVIILRQGLSARALVDDSALLKRLESKARLQMNSINAINASLVGGLGCAIATRHFMSELLADGTLHARPIIAPELSRRLYVCEIAERPATFALETVRRLLLDLIAEAVARGKWDASLLIDGPDR
jgi:LysR family nitrogen assimilation transcriptional regulator